MIENPKTGKPFLPGYFKKKIMYEKYLEALYFE